MQFFVRFFLPLQRFFGIIMQGAEHGCALLLTEPCAILSPFCTQIGYKKSRSSGQGSGKKILLFRDCQMKARYIDEDIIGKIRSELDNDKWLILWVAVETGLRIGDIVSLRPSNLQGRAIFYTAQKTGKSGEAPVSSGLFWALVERAKDSEWVFPSPYVSGQHITRQAVWSRIKKACERAGVDPKGISPHSLRKHFAVHLFQRSGLRATQRALQHDRSATTEIYALSDYSSGKNAELPLTRGDIPMIVELVAAAVCLRVDKS